MRLIALTAVFLLLSDSGVFAGGPWQPDWSDLREEGGSSLIPAQVLDNAIAYVLLVIVAPAGLFYMIWGVYRDSRLTDAQWSAKYPNQYRKDSDRKIGLGTILMFGYLAFGVGFFWLLIVSPETLDALARR